MFSWKGLHAGSVYLEFNIKGYASVTYAGDLLDVQTDLVVAVTAVLEGAPASGCAAFLEPGRREWTFIRTGDSFTLRVESFDIDGNAEAERTVEVAGVPLLPFAECVLSATREMVTGGLGVSYEDGWPAWPAPVREVETLERAIERQRANL